MLGAVFGRGVVGVIVSPRLKGCSGAWKLFTAPKTDIFSRLSRDGAELDQRGVFEEDRVLYDVDNEVCEVEEGEEKEIRAVRRGKTCESSFLYTQLSRVVAALF